MPEPVAVVSTTSADTPAVSTVSKSIPSHIEPESVIGFSGEHHKLCDRVTLLMFH